MLQQAFCVFAMQRVFAAGHIIRMEGVPFLADRGENQLKHAKPAKRRRHNPVTKPTGGAHQSSAVIK
jgi:hypothetical protein